MKQSNRLNWLGIFSGICLLGAIVLLVLEMVLFSRTFAAMPAGLTLGGVPVGGLSEQQALERLGRATAQPPGQAKCGTRCRRGQAAVDALRACPLPQALEFKGFEPGTRRQLADDLKLQGPFGQG